MPANILLRAAFVVSVLCPSALWAADGVLLVQSVNDGAKTTAASSQVQMEPNRIRTEVHDGDGRRQVVIFNGATEVLYIIDPERKSYIEVTKAEAARLGSMMQGAMAMMQQQMANLPPAQRAMLEQKMGGMMGGGATAVARPEYKRNGTGKVGDRTCDRYDGYTAGQKTSEICTVTPEALGFALADFGVLTKLSDFVRTILPQMADQIVGVGSPAHGFSGLPIRSATTDPRSGRTITMQMTDARRATFEDAIFQVPAGFQKQSLLPSMGQ